MGKLIFKYGTMNSGKTTDLLMKEYHCNQLGFKTFLIKPALDTRSKTIKSRLGIEKEAILLENNEKIHNIVDNLEGYKKVIIFIDEIQFLPIHQVNEIITLVENNDNLIVFCYGLMIDYKNKPFHSSQILSSYANNVEEVKSFCKCGNKAKTHLLKQNGTYTFQGNGIFIGDIEYESVCFKCHKDIYNKFN